MVFIKLMLLPLNQLINLTFAKVMNNQLIIDRQQQAYGTVEYDNHNF